MRNFYNDPGITTNGLHHLQTYLNQTIATKRTTFLKPTDLPFLLTLTLTPALSRSGIHARKKHAPRTLP